MEGKKLLPKCFILSNSFAPSMTVVLELLFREHVKRKTNQNIFVSIRDVIDIFKISCFSSFNHVLASIITVVESKAQAVYVYP